MANSTWQAQEVFSSAALNALAITIVTCIRTIKNIAESTQSAGSRSRLEIQLSINMQFYAVFFSNTDAVASSLNTAEI